MYNVEQQSDKPVPRSVSLRLGKLTYYALKRNLTTPCTHAQCGIDRDLYLKQILVVGLYNREGVKRLLFVFKVQIV